MSKPVKVSLIITSIGLLILLLIIPYYALNLGIKPCQGLPSDAANCGDADLGGAVIFMVGAPVFFIGIVSLIVSAIYTKFSK